MRKLLFLALTVASCTDPPEAARVSAVRDALLPLPAAATFGERRVRAVDPIVTVDAREDESYTLDADTDGVRISGGAAGVFYGRQTLRQLISDGYLTEVHIEDAPRFPWRGLMLDVARHFFPPDEIKRYVDLM